MTALNIGANSFREDGWLNLDHPSTRYSGEQAKIDVPHDLMSGEAIALNDNTLTAAYTSHTIEHISDQYVEQKELPETSPRKLATQANESKKHPKTPRKKCIQKSKYQR